MYESATFVVKCGKTQRTAELNEYKDGLFEGDQLSPKNFAFYIAALTDKLTEASPHPLN